MECKKISEVTKGDYVRRSLTTSKTYKKGDYDRASKKFSLIDCADVNHEIFVVGTCQVFIGFTY